MEKFVKHDTESINFKKTLLNCIHKAILIFLFSRVLHNVSFFVLGVIMCDHSLSWRFVS